MKHPAFDVLRNLADNGAGLDTVRAFKEQVWTMPVWIAGSQADAGNGQTSTQLKLDPGEGDGNPSLPMFVDEADAIRVHGEGGYFASRFRVAVLFGESSRMDVFLVEGDMGIRITHDKLMELRDFMRMGGEDLPMDAEEMTAQQDAIMAFAIRAREYCGCHADIDTLHLAVLMTTGVKPMLVGTMASARAAAHGLALEALSKELFQPRWRFAMYEAAPFLAELAASTPCYSKAQNTGLWNRFKNGFKAPDIGMIKLIVEPDEASLEPVV